MPPEPLELSVLIPTHRRPVAVARCLRALAAQSPAAGEHEIVLGFDGPDPDGEAAADRAWHEAGGAPGRLRIVPGPRRGYIDVRHRLLPTLRGRVVVHLNDDVVPAPDFLAVHRRAHEELAAAGRRAMIVGDSRFAPVPDPTLLDAALDRTGIVFFWHAMSGEPPARDWGFRHAFGLNLSVPRSALDAAGGMPSVPDTYGYDDVELGWRLARRGLPVLHRPAAKAPHEHRYRAPDLLGREFRLGQAAVRYARIAPAFAADLFGRDILGEAERQWARSFLERERSDLLRRRDRFLGLDHVPAASVGESMLPLACELVADHARPLRRACWSEGLLAELGEPVSPATAVTPGPGPTSGRMLEPAPRDRVEPANATATPTPTATTAT